MSYYTEKQLLRMQELLLIANSHCPYGEWVVGLEGVEDDGREYTLRLYKDLRAGAPPVLVGDIGVLPYDTDGRDAQRAADHQAFLNRCLVGPKPEGMGCTGCVQDVLEKVQQRLLGLAADIQQSLAGV